MQRGGLKEPNLVVKKIYCFCVICITVIKTWTCFIQYNLTENSSPNTFLLCSIWRSFCIPLVFHKHSLSETQFFGEWSFAKDWF